MKAIVKTAICPLQSRPEAHSELADEALYGMVVELLERVGTDWYKVRTHYRYEGYAPASSLLIGDAFAEKWLTLPKKVILHKNTCDVMFAPKVQSYPLVSLTRGAVVSPTGEVENGWQKVILCDGTSGYVRASWLDTYYDAPACADEDALRAHIVANAMRYVGTHYRWGGKSPMGIDCSGLCSTSYLLSGVIIYRDAGIKDGFPIHEIPMEQIKPADLIFFPGHVAMYLGEGRYIHSTGHEGDDGVTFNSLDPNAPDYRDDLFQKISAVGSYF